MNSTDQPAVWGDTSRVLSTCSDRERGFAQKRSKPEYQVQQVSEFYAFSSASNRRTMKITFASRVVDLGENLHQNE
jgi:hypothetical protein